MALIRGARVAIPLLPGAESSVLLAPKGGALVHRDCRRSACRPVCRPALAFARPGPAGKADRDAQREHGRRGRTAELRRRLLSHIADRRDRAEAPTEAAAEPVP